MRFRSRIALVAIVAFVLFAGVSLAESKSSPPPTSASPQPSASVSPTTTPVPLPPLVPHRVDLKVGEKHIYEITWKNISGGTGEISVVQKVKDREQYYLLHMSAKSSPLVSVFYKVEDLFVSHMNVESGKTLRFERHVREGKNFREELVDFDYADKKVKYNQSKQEGTEPRKFDFPLNGSILDPLSGIMFLRGMDFTPGEEVALPVHSNEEDWILRLKVASIVGLRVTGVGKFTTYKLIPQAKEDALFTAKGAMTVWIEKTTHVVLRAEVNIPIGAIVIRLIRAENSPLETVNRTEKVRRWIRPGTKDLP